MIKRGLNKGFTIVELLIVIIVVAILATLVALSYGNSQIQARDTQMRDAADKFADAIKLMQLNTGAFPKGGYDGTTNNSLTATGCSIGSTGWQTAKYYSMVGDTHYKCTIGDAAIALGYLPANFFDSLPINTSFGGVYNSFMVTACGGKNYLFYPLEKATTAEAAALSNLTGTCPGALDYSTNYGMRAVEDLTIQ